MADGRILASRLWRSDNITISPDEQLQDLHAEGLRTVIDLRAPDEVRLTGTAVLKRHGIRHLHRPMTRKSADPATLAVTFDAVKDYDDVGDWYLRLARARALVLLDCVRDIATAEGGVLFCCTAGKDRTGILAAVVLLLLHAEEDLIVDDYARTGEVMDLVHLRHAAATGRPMPSTRFPDHPILHAHPDSMAAFLRGVRATGGVRSFLADAAAAKGHEGARNHVDDLAGRLHQRLVVGTGAQALGLSR